jgi:hypothetical protein
MGRGKSQASLESIRASHEILYGIQPASVRAVCYQLFMRNLIPDMSKSSTNRVSTQLVYAREHQLIPWEWIVDETRDAETVVAWDDLANYANDVRRSYRRNRWKDQPRQVEVWSEKGTVRGTLAPVLNQYGVTFRVMHGYSSATTVNQVADQTYALRRAAAPALRGHLGHRGASSPIRWLTTPAIAMAEPKSNLLMATKTPTFRVGAKAV